jgi:hypothetical protein
LEPTPADIATLPPDPEIFTSPHVPAVPVPVSEGDKSLRVPEVPASLVDPNTLYKGGPVCALSVFIRWLESTDSPVQEFGISNASLEEVFLAVTKNVAPGAQHNNETLTGCCSCCKKSWPKTSTEVDSAIQSNNAIFTLQYTKSELK